jgi:hypothetical protein
MALTVGTPVYLIRPFVHGKKIGWVDITFDSSYPTGGEAIAATDIDGLTASIDVLLFFSDSGGYVFDYDDANDKIKAYWVDTTTDGAPMAQVANATDLSGVTAKFLFIGA